MINKYARNILYILPTRDWGTRERAAFRDIELAQKHGYNVFLCTYEDAFLARLVRTLDIEVISVKESFLNRFSKFHKHIALGPIFKKHKIDIVHCYEFNVLFSLSIQLKTENLTSLIVTMDHIIDGPLKRFWYRPLISRIDSLILMNKNLLQDAQGNLDLPLKKIEYFGMGLKLEAPLDPDQIAFNFELYKDYFLAGTYVSPEINDSSSLIPLLSALKVINEKLPGGRKSKLVFLSAVDFQSLSILPDIMRLIQEQELEEDVLFVTTKDMVGVITHLNLWISCSDKELIEDFAIAAMIHEVPAIMCRNFCSRDLLEEYDGIGETYKMFDARELRDKWEKTILGNVVFKEKTRVYKYFIEREHSYRNYKTQFLGLYMRTVQRRARLFKRR